MFLTRRLRNERIMNIVQLQVFTNSFYFHSKSDFRLCLQPPFCVIFRHLVVNCGIRQHLLKPKLIAFLYTENLKPSTLQNVGAPVCFLYMLSWAKEIACGDAWGWNFMSWKGWAVREHKIKQNYKISLTIILSLKKYIFLSIYLPFKVSIN